MNRFCSAHLFSKRSFAWVSPLALAVVASVMTANDAQAQNAGLYGFQPFGFYQPYGIQYRSSVATPPYFAVNPPVYYGTRHYRPYGISPFATPPQVTGPPNYHGQPAASGMRSQHYTGPVGNPFICQSDAAPANRKPTADETVSANYTAKNFVPGKIQTNPFAQAETHLASRYQ